jgi:CarD family transcriptional regulator
MRGDENMAAYQVNDTVVYGPHGVCKITEISERDMTGRPMEYYVLKPIYYDTSTIFVPSGNEALTSKMRPVLSADEIDELIKNMPEENYTWIDDENERKAKYRDTLSGGDTQDLVRLVQALYLRKESQTSKGKKLRYADENTLKDAERVLNEEFAHAFNIKRDQVASFIRRKLREAGKQL